MKKTLLIDVIQFCVSSCGSPVAGSTGGVSLPKVASRKRCSRNASVA